MKSQKTKSLQTLEKIEGHPYFYQSPISKIIYYRKRINNKPIKFSTNTTSIKEAKKFVDNKLIELFSENPLMEKRQKSGVKNPLLRDIWKELIELKKSRSSEGTLESYNTSWNFGLSEFWGGLTTLSINEQSVKKFEDWYLKSNSKRGFFNTRKHLIMLFNYCVSNGYISKKPKVSNLDPIINKNLKRKKVGREYSDEEIKKMISVASLERTKVAIVMGRFLGMRKMEVLTQVWENIDFKKNIITVWSMKNKKWRSIYMPQIVLDYLKNYKKVCESNKWVFPNSDDSLHITSQMFDKNWKRTQRKAEIEGSNDKNGARFHDLRHTFASQTARDNWPPLHACEVLDMSLDEYQRTYVHVASFDIKTAMENSFGGKNNAK